MVSKVSSITIWLLLAFGDGGRMLFAVAGACSFACCTEDDDEAGSTSDSLVGCGEGRMKLRRL